MREFQIYQTANGGWCAGYYAGTDCNRKVNPLACGLASATAVEQRLKELYPNEAILVVVPLPTGTETCVLGLIEDAITDKMILNWIDQFTTLYHNVEHAYVVDGYEVSITNHDNVVHGPCKGQTLREAFAKAYVATVNITP